MPKVLTSYYNVVKVLKTKKIYYQLEYDLLQIKNTIELKNVPMLAKFTGYIEEIPVHICASCEERVYTDFRFCPYCSQKLKFVKGV